MIYTFRLICEGCLQGRRFSHTYQNRVIRKLYPTEREFLLFGLFGYPCYIFWQGYTLSFELNLAGMPAVATACEWACSHDAANSHGDHVSHASSVDHNHHGAAAIAGVSATRFAAAVAPDRDCCGDVIVSPASVRTGRIDASISLTFDSFLTAETRLQTLRPATATHLSRTAPPGCSPQTARSLPLRI